MHILYLVLALGVGAGLYAGASHYRKQKEDQRNYRKIIRTDFTFTPIPQHSDMGN
ncbi:MAG: hypothetical protein LBD11_04555 [Candidatus Peribacteria bacterium]|nr:hypothetical protein [Candidatus Peribacteria bacterium]